MFKKLMQKFNGLFEDEQPQNSIGYDDIGCADVELKMPEPKLDPEVKVYLKESSCDKEKLIIKPVKNRKLKSKKTTLSNIKNIIRRIQNYESKYVKSIFRERIPHQLSFTISTHGGDIKVIINKSFEILVAAFECDVMILLDFLESVFPEEKFKDTIKMTLCSKLKYSNNLNGVSKYTVYSCELKKVDYIEIAHHHIVYIHFYKLKYGQFFFTRPDNSLLFKSNLKELAESKCFDEVVSTLYLKCDNIYTFEDKYKILRLLSKRGIELLSDNSHHYHNMTEDEEMLLNRLKMIQLKNVEIKDDKIAKIHLKCIRLNEYIVMDDYKGTSLDVQCVIDSLIKLEIPFVLQENGGSIELSYCEYRCRDVVCLVIDVSDIVESGNPKFEGLLKIIGRKDNNV